MQTKTVKCDTNHIKIDNIMFPKLFDFYIAKYIAKTYKSVFI